MGFDVNNDLFAEHSWYFRNALVRANYKNMKNNVYATNKYVEFFLENLLLGENNILKNRELHINYVSTENIPNKSDINNAEKLGVNKNTPNLLGVNNSKMLGVKFNKNQFKMLKLIKVNNNITIIEMAKTISISETAIENNLKKLKEKGVIYRIGSDKTGSWAILETGINE